jgi:hypothetical protein
MSVRWIAIAASVSAAAAALILWAPWRAHTDDVWPWFALIPLTNAFVHAVAAIAPTPRRWFATGVITGVILGLIAGLYGIAAVAVLVISPREAAVTFWLGLGTFAAATAFSLLMALRADRLDAPIPTATARART